MIKTRTLALPQRSKLSRWRKTSLLDKDFTQALPQLDLPSLSGSWRPPALHASELVAGAIAHTLSWTRWEGWRALFFALYLENIV